MPSTKNWGTRSDGAFGCGKCRWRPRGCRGCIAAAPEYARSAPPPPPMPRGEVSIPRRGIDEDCDKFDRDERQLQLGVLLQAVEVSRVGQSDAHGSGVVARRRLRPSEVLADPSVVFVARPSEYAVAHLPQYHALELGTEGYFRLREPAYAHCSLIYYVNETRHLGAEGPPANVKYKVVRPMGGGIALGLEVLEPVEAGTELLCVYGQTLSR